MTNILHGKWGEEGVPHKGWNCVWVDDLGEVSEVCEMCEHQSIRYVHYMEHTDYEGELGVGCVCAENMTEDYVTPRNMERELKKNVRRKRTWLLRKWKRSEKGNSFINTDGFNIAVFEKNGVWKVRIENRDTGEKEYSRRRYDSENEAKLGALAGMIWMKSRIV